MEKQVASRPRLEPERVQNHWDRFPVLTTGIGWIVKGGKLFMAGARAISAGIDAVDVRIDVVVKAVVAFVKTDMFDRWLMPVFFLFGAIVGATLFLVVFAGEIARSVFL
jgi:hypothetical protein